MKLLKEWWQCYEARSVQFLKDILAFEQELILRVAWAELLGYDMQENDPDVTGFFHQVG